MYYGNLTSTRIKRSGPIGLLKDIHGDCEENNSPFECSMRYSLQSRGPAS